MKHFLIIQLTALCFFITGCNISDNGDLDGFWYLTKIDSISNNTSVPMREAGISWSFQAKLMQVGSHNSNAYWKYVIMSRFNHQGNQLELSEPFIYDRMNGDVFLTADSLHRLTPFGINSIPDLFIVEKLSSSKLQICDQTLRLYFEKY